MSSRGATSRTPTLAASSRGRGFGVTKSGPAAAGPAAARSAKVATSVFMVVLLTPSAALTVPGPGPRADRGSQDGGGRRVDSQRVRSVVTVSNALVCSILDGISVSDAERRALLAHAGLSERAIGDITERTSIVQLARLWRRVLRVTG